MAQTPVFNDGSLNYGSIKPTLSGGATVIFDNFTINRNVKEIEQTDENDQPLRAVGIPEFVKGTAEMQVPSTLTSPAVGGQTFTVTLDATIGAETFLIVNVGDTIKKDAARMASITVRKKYN